MSRSNSVSLQYVAILHAGLKGISVCFLWAVCYRGRVILLYTLTVSLYSPGICWHFIFYHSHQSVYDAVETLPPRLGTVNPLRHISPRHRSYLPHWPIARSSLRRGVDRPRWLVHRRHWLQWRRRPFVECQRILGKRLFPRWDSHPMAGSGVLLC